MDGQTVLVLDLERKYLMRAFVEAAFMAIHVPLVDAYTYLLSILPN